MKIERKKPIAFTDFLTGAKYQILQYDLRSSEEKVSTPSIDGTIGLKLAGLLNTSNRYNVSILS